MYCFSRSAPLADIERETERQKKQKERQREYTEAVSTRQTCQGGQTCWLHWDGVLPGFLSCTPVKKYQIHNRSHTLSQERKCLLHKLFGGWRCMLPSLRLGVTPHSRSLVFPFRLSQHQALTSPRTTQDSSHVNDLSSILSLHYHAFRSTFTPTASLVSSFT